MRLHILVVDDDADILMVLRDWLQWNGHGVTTVSDGQAAIDAIERKTPDLVFLDLEMPKLRGPEVLRQVRHKWPDLPVIIITAHGTIPLAVAAATKPPNVHHMSSSPRRPMSAKITPCAST